MAMAQASYSSVVIETLSLFVLFVVIAKLVRIMAHIERIIGIPGKVIGGNSESCLIEYIALPKKKGHLAHGGLTCRLYYPITILHS